MKNRHSEITMDFYGRVAAVCGQIPEGKVATYGQIALLCGKPKNARQVGYALRHNLAGRSVPAHRVVNAQGMLSGAGYFETWDLQKLLLADEGVEAAWTPKGWQVDLRRFGWKNTMEEALTLRRRFETVILRDYISSDCEGMAQLFYRTVHTVNAGDYTGEQLDAWAPGSVDLEAWNRSFLEHVTVVAAEGDRIVGFGDLDHTGYLDRLYVHVDYQGRGIAAAICDRLEEAAAGKKITTHASITARPFFERRGYRVRREQQVERNGIWLTNFVMEKDGQGL